MTAKELMNKLFEIKGDKDVKILIDGDEIGIDKVAEDTSVIYLIAAD